MYTSYMYITYMYNPMTVPVHHLGPVTTYLEKKSAITLDYMHTCTYIKYIS